MLPKGFLDLESQVKEKVFVQASVNASNPQLYNEIHGKNLYHKALENIKKIKSFFKTTLSSTIYQENLNDVPNLINLADNLNLPIRFNLVFPVGKGKDVDRLDAKQVDQLRGYLLKQRILKGAKIDSPLIHTNNCPALAKTYKIQKEGSCPLDHGKVYVSPNGERKGCEFYNFSSQLNQTLEVEVQNE